MNEQTLKIVVAFNDLPETDGKEEIKRKFLNDEVSPFEFYSLASQYLENQNENRRTLDNSSAKY